MKATIYALVDPNTHQVRYVGRTTQTAAQRLRHHIGAAKRGTNKHVVYDWIRALLPSLPVLVILQEDVQPIVRGRMGWTSGAELAETKWKKRLERSPLLCVIPRDTENYKTFVNPPTVKMMRRQVHK